MDLKCSFWSVGLPCGAEGVGLKICPLLSCTQDIESYWLVSLGLGRKRGATGSKVSEADLILNGAGKFDVPEDEKRGMTVCPRHHKNLTTDWTGRKQTTVNSLVSDHPWCMTKWSLTGGGRLRERSTK